MTARLRQGCGPGGRLTVSVLAVSAQVSVKIGRGAAAKSGASASWTPHVHSRADLIPFGPFKSQLANDGEVKGGRFGSEKPGHIYF
jgi:hypothetical protein